MPTAEPNATARTLASLLEPVAGQVYFSPECHANYAALGFAPSPGDANGVALPDGAAYFTSRGSVMGQVPGEVIAAAFGVFNPAGRGPGRDARLDADRRDHHLPGARRRGDRAAAADPRRRAGRRRTASASCSPGPTDTLRPEGRPLYAGQRSQPSRTPRSARPGVSPTCCASTAATRTRSPTRPAGFDATEIGLVSEQWWGLAARSYSRTRAWSEAEFDEATERLRSRGVFDADGTAHRPRARRARTGRAGDRRPARRADRRARRRRRRAVRAAPAVGRGDPRRSTATCRRDRTTSPTRGPPADRRRPSSRCPQRGSVRADGARSLAGQADVAPARGGRRVHRVERRRRRRVEQRPPPRRGLGRGAARRDRPRGVHRLRHRAAARPPRQRPAADDRVADSRPVERVDTGWRRHPRPRARAGAALEAVRRPGRRRRRRRWARRCSSRSAPCSPTSRTPATSG